MLLTGVTFAVSDSQKEEYRYHCVHGCVMQTHFQGLCAVTVIEYIPREFPMISDISHKTCT